MQMQSMIPKIARMATMQHLSVLSRVTSSTPKSCELAGSMRSLKQEMRRCRTDAKGAAIFAKTIDKIGPKMAEQASTHY